MFEMFSTAIMVSFLIANIKSSANATALKIFVNLMFSRELYRIFHYPGSQQDPCEDDLVTVLDCISLTEVAVRLIIMFWAVVRFESN